MKKFPKNFLNISILSTFSRVRLKAFDKVDFTDVLKYWSKKLLKEVKIEGLPGFWGIDNSPNGVYGLGMEKDFH